MFPSHKSIAGPVLVLCSVVTVTAQPNFDSLWFVGIKKFQYDIWGDTVNTASRMESSGEVGQVNISQTTYDLVKEDPAFNFISRGKVEAKGKGEMEMYFIDMV